MAAAPPPALPGPLLPPAPGAAAPEGCPLGPAGLGDRRAAGGAAGAAARCEACGKASCPAPAATPPPQPCPRGVPGARRGRGRAPAAPLGQARPAGPGGAGRGAQRDKRSPKAASPAVRGCALRASAGSCFTNVARCRLALSCCPPKSVRGHRVRKEELAAGASAEERWSGRGARPACCSLVPVPAQRWPTAAATLLGCASSSGARGGPRKDAAGRVAAQRPPVTGGASVGFKTSTWLTFPGISQTMAHCLANHSSTETTINTLIGFSRSSVRPRRLHLASNIHKYTLIEYDIKSSLAISPPY
ncbi:collagen alpha-2(I) chain-like [Aquila chrysaetos chrysaetos]|uniref:collagen alpha-2(I) chain-like n=1 Tax=Aquila chrysaetos chrysaetos TaxID=223781 RepID=UPI001176B733|nr:collagen alpha-2(I) chain-like [Aquila chrysaetos chrysaetos]